MSATRTPPTGPLNGRPDSWVDSEAALMASTSYGASGCSASTVMTTWTSLRNPDTKVGRSGRSMSRQVRIASSEGLPSRRKNEPGCVPRRTCAPRRRPSAGRSRTAPWGACRRSSPTAAWFRRRGRQRRSLLPAGRAARSRSGWCGCRAAVVDNGLHGLGVGSRHGSPFSTRDVTRCAPLGAVPQCCAGQLLRPVFDRSLRGELRPMSQVPKTTTEDRRPRIGVSA